MEFLFVYQRHVCVNLIKNKAKLSLHVNAHLVAEEHYSIMPTFLPMKHNKGLLLSKEGRHEYHTVSIEIDIPTLLFSGCKIS